MGAPVLSETLSRRLQSFFDKNKDAVPAPPPPDEAPEKVKSDSDSGAGARAGAASSANVREDDDDKDDDEPELQPLDAKATDLSLDLCSNRIRRNFLRYYLVEHKRRKEKVFLDDDGILVSSVPYMTGVVELRLELDGYFSCFLVGAKRETRYPMTFSIVPQLADGCNVNNVNNGRINGLANKGVTTFDLKISEKHAVHWFQQSNKYRRLSNSSLFRKQVLRWQAAVQQKKKDHEARAIARRKAIDEKIRLARELGLARV